ncbi:hypothetical protein [Halorhabdus tiamatea]|nr:hypothetical protein [Halorhabdus tiamatea]
MYILTVMVHEWLVGVHGVGYSDNVILYREHLQSGNGTSGADERVDEQVGIHEVDDDDPGAQLTDNGPKYHSNVHVGELHWDTDPTSEASTPEAQTQLTVEVDYVRNESWPANGSPFEINNTNNVALIEAIERNYALYGVDLEFVESDELTREDITFQYPGYLPDPGTRIYDPEDIPMNQTDPSQLNRWELGKIEDEYHNDTDALHMLWGTSLGDQPDEPSSEIDERTSLSGATGMAMHVGSPDGPLVNQLPYETGFGIMIARDDFSKNDFHGLQSVGMHELGHAFSIGWADDAPIPTIGGLVGEHAYEVYSGNIGMPNRAGGIDPTPENVSLPNSSVASPTYPWWSLMKFGPAFDTTGVRHPGEIPVLHFSLEELSTVDFEAIPSKED